jgi:hypothetical protein
MVCFDTPTSHAYVLGSAPRLQIALTAPDHLSFACAYSSTDLFPFPLDEIHMQFHADSGEQVLHSKYLF